MRVSLALAFTVCLVTSGCKSGPWYQLGPDADQRYLPLGDAPTAVVTLDADGDAVDVYYPTDRRAPITIFLPGASVVKERYRWVGAVLASHGVAVAIPQPPRAFPSSHDTTATLAALRAADDDAGSALAGKLDVGRVLLSGHSVGTVVQAGLTFPAGCPVGFCEPGVTRPPGLRGLALLAFHNQAGAPADDAPMPAAEVPWLMITGSRDGLTTPDKAAATFDRLQDRPIQLVEVEGMCHFQLTEWVDPVHDTALPADLEPTIASRDARAAAATYLVAFARRVLLDDAAVAPDLGAAGDARVRARFRPAHSTAPPSSLPRVMPTPVGDPGFGDPDNAEVVATAAHDGALYLLVRNDVSGAQLFRLRGGAIEKLPLPASPRTNALLGALASWRGQLWIGLSAGVQGSRRDASGAELWRFDGAAFTPVIAAEADADPTVQVASVDGCGQPTARITVAGGGLAPGALAGATLDDRAAHADAPMVLEVLDNDGASLTVRSGESALGDDTVACDALAAGATLALRQGSDEPGFGQPWNKAIPALAVDGERLYVATGLNLRDGAEVWSSDDGAHFSIAVPRSFLGTHANGHPITSSVTSIRSVALGGTSALYLGLNGTENHGARLALYADGQAPHLVLDGDAGGNAQISDVALFADRVWLSAFNFGGLELSSAGTTGAWQLEVGPGAAQSAGFGDPTQFVARLFPVGGQLWAATVANVLARADLRDESAQVWRTDDGQTWQLVTAHAFGINSVTVSSVFAWDGAVWAAAGSGTLASRGSFRPLQLYRLSDETIEGGQP